MVIVDSAHSVLAFGPETIRVYVAEKDGRVRNHIVTTKLANDGGGISGANVKMEWMQPDIIKFCFTGVEQEDSVLEISVRMFSYTEGKEKCSQVPVGVGDERIVFEVTESSIFRPFEMQNS